MRRFLDTPIKRKFTLVMLLSSGAAVLVACLAFVGSELFTFRRAMAGELTTLADVLANNSTAALSFNDPATATETLSAMKAEPRVVATCVYNKDNAAFAQYTRRGTDQVLPPRPGKDGHEFVGGYLVLFRPIVLDNKRIGTIYVQADLERMYARLRSYAEIALIVLLVACAVAFAISYRLQRVISNPILELAQTATRISDRRDFSVRAKQQSEDEIGLLTKAFNQMLTTIEEREGALRTANAALEAEIAERRRAQEELIALNLTLEQRVAERTRESVEANRAKSEFLANMSHELRTPLNSVIGFANILLKNKAQNLRNEDLAFLDRIVANGKHLLLLINQILDLSKIEARKTELEIAPVSLDLLIHETIAQLEAEARGKNVRLITELPRAMSPIQTDTAKLKQVMINLLGNALKFTEKGRVIVRVSTGPDDTRPARIDVIDTGIGIPQERLGVIFEAFQQAEAGTARKYGGTGLGLTISQALCQLMGYHIEVISEVGRGSTFSVVLAPKPATTWASPAAGAPQP